MPPMKQDPLQAFAPWPKTRLSLWAAISCLGFWYRAYYTTDESVVWASAIPVIAFGITAALLSPLHRFYTASQRKG